MKFSRKQTVSAGVMIGLLIIGGIILVRANKSNENGAPDEQVSTQQQSVAETDESGVPQPCGGNSSDDCIGSPSIDFYPSPAESASNPELKATGTHKEIMGRIVELPSDKNIVIKTSSGRTISVNFPIDAVDNFNQNISSNYQGLQVGVGDMLRIDYYENTPPNIETINASQIQLSSLILKNINIKANPDAKLEKY